MEEEVRSSSKRGIGGTIHLLDFSCFFIFLVLVFFVFLFLFWFSSLDIYTYLLAANVPVNHGLRKCYHFTNGGLKEIKNTRSSKEGLGYNFCFLYREIFFISFLFSIKIPVVSREIYDAIESTAYAWWLEIRLRRLSKKSFKDYSVLEKYSHTCLLTAFYTNHDVTLHGLIIFIFFFNSSELYRCHIIFCVKRKIGISLFFSFFFFFLKLLY